MSRLLILAAALLAAAAPADRPSAAVTAWARAAAVPLSDDAAVLRAMGNARVLAVGEFTHGAHEPLALRNRLVRLLGEAGRLDMVVLESGLVEGRRLNDYVMGGPGDAAEVARHNLNWGFGRYPENVELLRWLREHNRRNLSRPIAIHGNDVPGGDDRVIGNPTIAIADAAAFLRRAAPVSDEGLLAALQPYAADLSLKRWFTLPPVERAALPRLADRLVAWHARHRAALAAATSAEEQAWAERTAVVLQQVIAVYTAWPTDNQLGNSPHGMYGVVEERDTAMAANTLWLLRRAQPGARMLLFMHNGHVAAGPNTGPLLPSFPRQYTVIGQRLRTALGPAMTVMLTNTATSVPSAKAVPNAPGSFGAALAAASPQPYLVDLSRAPTRLHLDQPWPMGDNLVANVTTPPVRAAGLVAAFPAATDVVPLAER